MADYFGKETPKLGFGLMRLPKKVLGTDIEQVKKMVDLFMEAGFTYFDTAFVYGADWNDPNVSSRANYEVARKHGKSITVMAPVKGGKLANPPAAVRKLFSGYAPDMSPASWAIRFVASLDGIITVLSGMSSVAQMEDNLSYMKNFQPMNEEEQKIIRQAQKILGSSAEIPCTACHYCTDGCPKQIPIPDIFAAANLQLGNGQTALAKERYAMIPKGHRTPDCIGCKQCERACPQHLKIVDYLKQCGTMLET